MIKIKVLYDSPKDPCKTHWINIWQQYKENIRCNIVRDYRTLILQLAYFSLADFNILYFCVCVGGWMGRGGSNGVVLSSVTMKENLVHWQSKHTQLFSTNIKELWQIPIQVLKIKVENIIFWYCLENILYIILFAVTFIFSILSLSL